MIRDRFADRLHRDLVGPGSDTETIGDRPGDRYLTGILFPPRIRLGADQDDDADTAGDAEAGGAGAEAVAGAHVMRPSTAGLSFALRAPEGSAAAITVQISGARYKGVDPGDERTVPVAWERRPVTATVSELVLEDAGSEKYDLGPYGLDGISLYLRTSRSGPLILVTAAVSNVARLPGQPGRRDVEEATFFQFFMEICAACGSELHPRPIGGGMADEDGRTAALIYRNTKEYAVGHVCSAVWDTSGTQVTLIRTSWIPSSVVQGMSARGDASFHKLFEDVRLKPLSAGWLSKCADRELIDGLLMLTAGYRDWISMTRSRVSDPADIPPHLHSNADENLSRCDLALERMVKGVRLVETDEKVRAAFQLANGAMDLQRQWAAGKALDWYPFQLAFSLLCIESLANPASDEREVMDLLWFPTGGGKTEAYLLLTAFTIFLRRLRATSGDAGGGVTVFMRYTLRLLTVQQFQRASALICACELIRLGRAGGAGSHFSALRAGPPISIGLWVGGDSTPNTFEAAVEALRTNAPSTPAQLRKCPCCGSQLICAPGKDRDRIIVTCREEGCEIAKMGGHLPVWTVDDDIYREVPSLIIGTADKYAQIARNSKTGRLFGVRTGTPPPELIIQDELHLISGPLGTMAGIYEIAIDGLCAFGGVRPKIIGSTATIRRAKEQIRALFDRDGFQFPPPGVDFDNSGFAVADRARAGRRYLGVSTAGRSAKFTLQAVTASLLQAAQDAGMATADADPYKTLVLYFNSLRELGASLVLMQDDVVKSMQEFSKQNGESMRPAPDVVELNSRISSSDIPNILEKLGIKVGDPDSVDVVLASNMISVGMDVPRLGLMLVNGQPKGIAEYIQATSRVGRGDTAGLVVTIYNAGKARDRSHFETFSTWHQSLYRDVEATSVTPYAPRARDRALHAALVALARHLVPGLESHSDNAGQFDDELEGLAEEIIRRARAADAREAPGVRRYLESRIDQWRARGPVAIWDDSRPDRTLLISAEKMASRTAGGLKGAVPAWPTPNSLRGVEASAEYVLLRDVEDDHQ